MAPIFDNLVYFIAFIFTFKLNMTFPYRNTTKNFAGNRPSRSKTILKYLQIYLFVSSNLDSTEITKQSNYNDQTYNYSFSANYQVPFSDQNILAIFTSEECNETNINKYPFHTTLNSNWSYIIEQNNLQHTTNGNRRLGYNLVTWNCRKGLLQKENEDTATFIDLKNLIQIKKPHAIGITEADIYGLNTTNETRTTRFSTQEVLNKLQIDGYSIVLPDSWTEYGVARVIVYTSDEIVVTKHSLQPMNKDLQSVTIDIGLGREKKTTVNFFYREWKGGISRENSQASQKDRLSRQIDHWNDLSNSGRDYIIMGDNNLCSKLWLTDNYQKDRKELGDMVIEFMLQEAAVQLVDEYTRSELVNGNLQRSCIDHIITNIPNKCNKPEVYSFGNSDHMVVHVKKFTKELRQHPNTIKKRSYKNFDENTFLNDIKTENFENVLNTDDLNTAAELFETKFKAILDKHAPIKIFQQFRNYVPYLSENTKNLMKERDNLKKIATSENNNELFKEYKVKRNLVKKYLEKDKKDYFDKKFNSENNKTTKNIWSTVYETLKSVKNLAPTKLKVNGKILNNPKEMANQFAKIFSNKTKKIREKTSGNPTIDPKIRLQQYLNQRGVELPEFKLKPIKIEKLRDIMKQKMKSKRSHGFDFIDSYSIKLAFPAIENVFLHLVNLSLKGSTFAKRWKNQLVLPLHKKNDKLVGHFLWIV